MVRVVVDAGDVVLDVLCVVATGLGDAHECRRAARLVLPLDERLQVAHVHVGTDDKHLAEVLVELVFGTGLTEVDETAVILSLLFWVNLHGIASADRLLVLSPVANLGHGDCHAGVDTQCLCHRVVSEWANHDVLSAEVSQDIRFLEIYLCRWPESILFVHRTINVRHVFRVDLTAEVTF